VKRILMAAILLPFLSACASLATVTAAHLPSTAGPTQPAAITEAPSVLPETVVAPSATPAPTRPPVVAQPVPPPAPLMRSATFPIIAIGRRGVSGVVQISQSGSRFVASVSVRGLPTGMPTFHTVHIHAGSCSNPYGGMHLTVLGILGANATGAGSFSSALAGVYVTSGRYVIVYADLTARVIVGCANLAGLM
jgi:hypothetical protein